ncbi:hypothetical protein C5S29_09255 [ANME-1 cluster archaeon GoMg3.2]|nr:hypothetical protein [ANME-1 cluster archaeon GoMg3.2]
MPLIYGRIMRGVPMGEKTEKKYTEYKEPKKAKNEHYQRKYIPLILVELAFALSVFFMGLWLNTPLSVQLIISSLGILLIYAVNWLWPFIQLKEL